jgi:hypothetical protein
MFDANAIAAQLRTGTDEDAARDLLSKLTVKQLSAVADAANRGIVRGRKADQVRWLAHITVGMRVTCQTILNAPLR